jgi:hypothetical protein
MNFNFFEWIRQGVKQSVLLGVTDAVGHLGTPQENDDITQRLMSFAQEGMPALPAASAVAMPANRQIGLAPRRKKLGRSLEDIQSTADRRSASPAESEVEES